jgi:RNA polymerase sigma factor (sigma-70 family)
LLIGNYQAQEAGAEDALWEAVIDQLLWSASQMLYRFPALSLDPRELMGELWERLAKFLAGHTVVDRRHFFSVACRHMRYLLLDLARKPVLSIDTSSKCDELLDILADPVQQAILDERRTLVQQALHALEQLDPTLQEIIDYHVLLGMSFRDIAKECGIPRATANDRYRIAMVALEQLMADSGGGATS